MVRIGKLGRAIAGFVTVTVVLVSMLGPGHFAVPIGSAGAAVPAAVLSCPPPAAGGPRGAVDQVTPWVAIPSMPTCRDHLAATTGSDGRIYALGGNFALSPLSIVEAYSPTLQS